VGGDNPGGHLKEIAMSAVVQAPVELVEAVAGMRFPARTDHRLRTLMDRNTDGQLTTAEREELESLVELSETITLVRTQALQLLGRSPT
jgi:hypothetical protein